jgi:hypothetical protein
VAFTGEEKSVNIQLTICGQSDQGSIAAMDISAGVFNVHIGAFYIILTPYSHPDLHELTRCQVGLCSAGVKSILDIGRCVVKRLVVKLDLILQGLSNTL